MFVSGADCSEELALRLISGELMLRRLKDDVFKQQPPQPQQQQQQSICCDAENTLAEAQKSNINKLDCSTSAIHNPPPHPPPPPKFVHVIRVILSPTEMRMCDAAAATLQHTGSTL
jgi:hypothetical protein